MIKKRSLTINISLLFFLSAFLVMTVLKIQGLIIIVLCAFDCLLLISLSNHKITLVQEDLLIIVLFYIVPYISLALSIVSVFSLGMQYVYFYPGKMGRMMNMSIYFIIFIFLINQKNKEKVSADDCIRLYLFGCCILAFFGIWQLMNSIFNIPYFDFNTRNQPHSINTENLFPWIKIRVTSLAREPAYLVPYLMDAGIIAFYSHKYKLLLVPVLIVLFFTLSLSGYINFFVIAAAVFILMPPARKLSAGIILVPCFLYIVYRVKNILLTVFARLDPNTLLASDRLQEVILPVNYMVSQTSLFNFIFGFGPKGMEYVSQFLSYHNNRQGEILGAEPHFIFVSSFVEYGFLGLVISLMFFYYLFRLAQITCRKTKNRFSQILCLNLLVSSLYTSDYASPRFTVIILFILFLYKDTKENA
jgi:hypothetical protein